MNNISLYNLVCRLKDRLENNPDSSKDQIQKAITKIDDINKILDIKERRSN